MKKKERIKELETQLARAQDALNHTEARCTNAERQVGYCQRYASLYQRRAEAWKALEGTQLLKDAGKEHSRLLEIALALEKEQVT